MNLHCVVNILINHLCNSCYHESNFQSIILIKRNKMKKETIQKGINYLDYRLKVAALILENKTTGTKQTSELVEFTKLNEQRSNRNEKQFVLSEQLSELFHQSSFNEYWIVFVEAWCGDCAQNLPAIYNIAKNATGVELKIVIKSENLEEMHQYLSNGSEAIPKLVRVEKESQKVLGTWGARPKNAQAIAEHWKKNKETIPKEDFEKELHLWYAKNRSQDIQREFWEMLTDEG